MRYRGWLVAAVAMMLVATAGPARGVNFGGHYVTSSCCAMYGTRADIGTPALDFTLGFGTFGLMRVSSDSASGGALMQTGFAQTNGWSLDGSCSSTTLKIFYEYVLPNILPGICGFLSSPGYGVAHKYSSFRSTSGTVWNGAVDGVVKASADLSFSVSSSSESGGEINGTGANNTGHLYGCYGCNGNLAWQRATAPGAASWYTIQSSYPFNDDGRWTIGATPSPFTISHPYP